MSKAQGHFNYRLRVVPPHVTISRPVTATEYIVTGLRANTNYTVYVRAVSVGLDGPEESVVGTTGGSECCNYFVYDVAMNCPKDCLIRFDVRN